MIIDTMAQLNNLLGRQTYMANGKNFPCPSLYPTLATSRWAYENLYGIYLTNATYAWMAVWIAVTSRQHLRKRHLQYHRPNTQGGDYIGRISVFDPEKRGVQEILTEKAYLHLFNQEKFCDWSTIDLRQVTHEHKVTELKAHGFSEELIDSGRWQRQGWRRNGAKTLVHIDEWQLALTNSEEVHVDLTVTLSSTLIRKLSERITPIEQPIGEDYIV